MNSSLNMISYILVVIGALNWGLYGLFNFNLVEQLLGAVPVIERLVYILVGIAGVVLLAGYKKMTGSSSTM